MTLELDGRPPIYESPDDMEAAIKEYFTKESKYSLGNLAIHLGMTPRSFRNYEKKDKFKEIVEYAKGRIEAYYEHEALHGGLDKTMTIFNLKANFGWRDKDEENKGNTIIIQDKGKEVVNAN
ncbi:MAG: terminase small subunit [Candidatus Thorarchaeota archaeon]|jgi:hypothetical protein